MKMFEDGIEKDKHAKTGLLDLIAERLECMYLSDLRGCVYKERCHGVIVEIAADDYSAKVWQEAVRYITGEEGEFNTAQDAKQRLLEYLSG